MSFVKLSDALKETVALRFHDDPAAYASYVLVVTQKVLESLFDLERFEDGVRPLTFDEGVLTLEVISGVQAHYFKLYSKEIITKINSQIGDRKVEQIKFRQSPSGSTLKP